MNKKGIPEHITEPMAERKTERMKTMPTNMLEKIEATSKVTSKGQITVPIEIRHLFKLKEGDQIRFVAKDGVVTVEPVVYTSIEDLFGILNQSEDNGNYVLDLERARAYRTEQVMKKYEETPGGD